MARLIACHTCTQQVSINAFACPHCGQTFARPWIKLGTIGILGTIAFSFCAGLYRGLFLLDDLQAMTIELNARTAFHKASIGDPSQPNTDYYAFHQFPYEDRQITTATPKHYHNLYSLMYIYPDRLICRSDNPSRQPLDLPDIDETTAICPPNSSPLE